MKAATVKDLKNELKSKSPEELMEICLTLSKFKKENKELLTYLLYDADDEEEYIKNVKEEIDAQFKEINTKSVYFMKKSIRKILRMTKKYIRYSKKKKTNVELRIYFLTKLREMKPPITRNRTLLNIFDREVASIRKTMTALHEDLQYDYKIELDEIA